MKALPQSIEAERDVLGAILYNPKIMVDMVNRLKLDDFYHDRHRLIYGAMCGLFAEGNDISLTPLVQAIGSENLSKVGGITYLSELQTSGMPIKPKQYIDILKDKSMRRKGIKEMTLAISKLYEDDEAPTKVLGIVSNSIINNENTSKTMLSDEELLTKTMEEIEGRYQSGGEIPGMKTGYPTIDKALNGLKRGELTIVAGRPSMGKTLLALNVGDGLVRQGYIVGLIEMEMTETSLGMRRLAYNAMINAQAVQTGKLESEDFSRLTNAFNKLVSKNGMFTDCSDYQSILTIKAKAKALKQAKGLDVLIVDHLGLMDFPRENMNISIGEITRQLKLLAKELDINIILISQLSRAVEQRGDKRPMLSDLRDSGNIEQDADLVMFCYRDAYYHPETTDKNIMEVIVAKQRNGKTGTLKMAYADNMQKISDLDFRR